MGNSINFLFKNTDDVGILNLLRSFVFGNETNIGVYDSIKIYHTADQVYEYDDITGNIIIYTAKEDNITGDFDISKWTSRTAKNSVVGDLTNYAVLQTAEPVSEDTRLWVMPLEISEHNLPEPAPIVSSTRYSVNLGDGIGLVSDTNDPYADALDINDIILDQEGSDGQPNEEIINEFSDSTNVSVDDQGGISVGDNTPDPSDPSELWVDTDLSDDQ